MLLLLLLLQPNRARIYSHIDSPKTQVSGFECNSTKTVGMQTSNTSKSAMDKLIRNKLVELRKCLVLTTTIGTSMLPQTPTLNMTRQLSVARIRKLIGKSIGTGDGLSFALVSFAMVSLKSKTFKIVALFKLVWLAAKVCSFKFEFVDVALKSVVVVVVVASLAAPATS